MQFIKLYGTLNYSTTNLLNAADAARYDLKSNTVQLGASMPVGQGSVLLSWARTNAVSYTHLTLPTNREV